VLRPGGRLVTIVEVERSADERGRAAYFIVEPSVRQLDEVARLIDSGALRPIVGKVFRLAEAREAYRFKPPRGKVVLQVIDNE
jgi:NADPH:quinone reductase-like Zn-dependent oxidoreductase